MHLSHRGGQYKNRVASHEAISDDRGVTVCSTITGCVSEDTTSALGETQGLLAASLGLCVPLSLLERMRCPHGSLVDKRRVLHSTNDGMVFSEVARGE